MKISVIIITLNEEDVLKACLESVKWVDEIIVLDSGSTDDTLKIARSYGSKIFSDFNWVGFGDQKNKALSHASGEWVLCIDSDERLSSELSSEIKYYINHSPKFDGLELPRLSSYCGRFMKHSGWWPDYVLRLFRRDCGRFSKDLVHEKVIVQGSVGQAKNLLIHDSFRDFEMVLNKVNKYSSLGAEQLHGKKKKSSLRIAIMHGLSSFIKSYFLKRGFLDGREGFMLAVSNAEGAYYKYLKLMLIQKNNP